MKCEDCEKDAKWRLNDGINAWGSIIYLFYCDDHKENYTKEMKKIAKSMGSHLYDGW